jgi:transcriptional regulator with XRE-family HTH domain
VAARNPVLRRRLGEVLRRARVEAGLTQEQLAERAGVHDTYVSLLERGLSSPSVDTIAAKAKGLGTKAHVLIESAER